MKKIENAKDIHVSMLKEVMEICGYHKEELENISFENLTLTEDGYILLTDERLDVEYAFSLEEYMKYSDWWTAVERDKKIDEIFKD